MLKKSLYAVVALSVFIALGLMYRWSYHEGFKQGFVRGTFTGYEFCKDEQKDTAIDTVETNITQCESSGRHENIWGDGGKSYGIAQFHERTFNWMKNLAGHPEYKWKNKADQLALLDWAIRNGYGGHWRHCYTRAVKLYVRGILPNLLTPVGANVAFLRKVGYF